MQDFKCFKTHLIQNKQTMNSLNFMLTFSHVLSQVAFYKLWNGWNRRTHGNSST
ncbi:hypothetical protein Hanom_Chr14g01296761 [Helianthus anomalus]